MLQNIFEEMGLKQEPITLTTSNEEVIIPQLRDILASTMAGYIKEDVKLTPSDLNNLVQLSVIYNNLR